MNFVSSIALLSAVFGTLLAATLWLARGRDRYANRVLSVVVLLSAGYMLTTVPVHSDLGALGGVLRAGAMLIFLIPPAIYLYVRSVVDPGYRLDRRAAVHLLPLLLLLVDAVCGDALWGGAMSSHLQWMGVVIYCLLLGYLAGCAVHLRRFASQLEDKYSDFDGIQLRWLEVLLGVFAVYTLLGLGIALYRTVAEFPYWPQQVFSVFALIGVNYLIAVISIARPALFASPQALEPEEPAAEESTPQYETSSLSPELAQERWGRLESVMQEQKPYLQNKLRQVDLAQQLGISSAHLSQVFSQVAGRSFFEYIQ